MKEKQYISKYKSPLGNIVLASDGANLVGLWFEGQKYFPSDLDKDFKEKELSIFKRTKKWLDIYFSGKNPDFNLPICFLGTKFQNEVWEILNEIPYGKTVTYGEIAKILAKKRGLEKMSSQAVGGAVSKNKISVIVPCHRVIGANGNLAGYAGGLDKKIALLKLENSFKDLGD